MRSRPIAAIAALAVAAALLLPTTAAAEFTAATLLSGTPKLQFESAEAPALAREGGYVAFQGSLAGVSGVWRRNLQTGAIEPVATSYAESRPELSAPSEALGAPDAVAPSISADGRYVAFTTTADLEPEHTNEAGEAEGEPAADEGCPEVYVRDMGLPAGAPGAYTLAAAVGKSGAGIVFDGGCHGLAGAQAAPGVALSEDGRSVAFTVLSRSNLAQGAGCPPSTQCPQETPASQVAVRNLEAGTTTVVSVTPEGLPTPGGGAFPSEQSETYPLGPTSSQLGDQITASTAAISGDGSTVAWLGTDVPAQVPGSEEIEEHFPASEEVEPLWRRISDGDGAFTRRLLAGAGLDLFFNRSEDLEVIRGGSFVTVFSGEIFIPPALSEDGNTVAVISNAPRPAQVLSVELGGSYPPQSDAYAVRVGDDATIAPQVIPLTETPNYDDGGTDAYGFVTNVAISSDGSRIAFDSERSQIALPALTLISPPATFRSEQAYVANLHWANLLSGPNALLGTLQRSTVTYNGAEPGGGAGLLSLSGPGGLLAFSSSATNLFYGDAGGTEVYLSREVPYEAQPATEHVESAPNEAPPAPEWKLNATAVAQRDGSVLLDVKVPGAGRLAVQAGAQMPTTGSAAKRSHSASLGRNRSSAGKRSSARAAAGVVRLTTRTIARASMSTATASMLQLRLRAGAAYRARIASRRGLYAVLHISFAASGHRTLTAQIPVTLHNTTSGAATKVSARKAARKKRRTRA